VEGAMCGPDTIDLICYDGKDSKVKTKIDKLRTRLLQAKSDLEKRQKSVQGALDAIKKKFG
jgi:hypothetical protein